ncbi:MAG TPA: hypothetical protein VGK19_24370 [Capsulimonadaceae bacterium]
MTCNGLGDRLTGPTTVSKNAGLTGGTARHCEQALNCPPDAEHPLGGLDELGRRADLLWRRWRDHVQWPRRRADGADDGDGECAADGADGVRLRRPGAVGVGDECGDSVVEA